MGAPKVATCCYCGTRAALVLTGKDRHELSCSSCGAPLHDLKMMPTQKRETVKSAPQPFKPIKRKKQKKRKKPKGYRMFKEVFDIVEDIFD